MYQKFVNQIGVDGTGAVEAAPDHGVSFFVYYSYIYLKILMLKF